MKKLFIAQPLWVPEEDFNMVRKTILDNLNESTLKYGFFTPDYESDHYELIDLCCGVNPFKEDLQYMLHLLETFINKMATADLIVFAPDWNKDELCVIEHLICEVLDLEYINFDDYI